jgi:hypothetical protein
LRYQRLRKRLHKCYDQCHLRLHPFAPSHNNVFNVIKDTIKKNTETVIDFTKKAGLEVNTEKTKYMLLSRHQNAEQNYDIKIADRCFENVAQFRYLGTIIIDEYLIQEKIKRRLNS